MIKNIIILITIGFFIGNVFAADLHVGSGQTYTTISAAITASSSGDTIFIHDGTYTELKNFPKGGTTLTGVDGEDMPLLDAEQYAYISDSNYDYTVFKLNGVLYNQDDIVFNRLDMRNGARATVATFDVDNVTFQNCNFQVADRSEDPPDNAGLLWIGEGTSNPTVENNTFVMNTMEYVGILMFEPITPIIDNNNLDINSNGSHGIFIKHAESPSTGRTKIRNNYVDMSGASGNAIGIFMSQDDCDIENNLIIGTMYHGIEIGLDAGGPGGTGSIIDHNTVYGTIGRGGFTVTNYDNETNITLTNNILYKLNTTTEYLLASWWIFGTDQTITDSDYNHYFENSVGSDIIKTGSTGAHTLTEWLAATSYDDSSINELQGFADGSGNLNTIADFEVVSGGGNNGASDGSDIGVDVDTVGVNANENNQSSAIGPGTSSTFSTGDSTVIN